MKSLSLLCCASHHQSHRPPAPTLNHSEDYRYAEKNSRDDGIAEDNFAGGSDTENIGTATPLTRSLSSQTSDLGPAGALSCLIVHNRVADTEKPFSDNKQQEQEQERPQSREGSAEDAEKQPDSDDEMQAGSPSKDNNEGVAKVRAGSFSNANDDEDDGDDEDDSGLDSPGSDAYVLQGPDGRGKGRGKGRAAGKQTPKRRRHY